LHGTVASCESECVVPEIGAKTGEFLAPVDRFKPENALREFRGAAEIVRGKTHIAQLFELNHSSDPWTPIDAAF
jgi:hypothetical protein